MVSYHSYQLVLCLYMIIISAWGYDTLITSNSTSQTHQLYDYLIRNYGKFILSGQTSFYYDDLVNKVHKRPIIQAFDMQNYSPHNPWFNWQPYDDGTVDKAIQWYERTNKKGIVSFHWHWFSPMGGQLRTSTFYTNYTDFNVSKAVVQGTQENIATLRDIDAIAVQLKKLQSKRIPLIWRPLHEAGGKWFWWGANTAQSCLKLYNMMYDRLVNYHKINNMIWLWSTPEQQWFPGNTKIDILGFDSYPGQYDYGCRLKSMINNNKMIVLSQNGPIPNINKCWSMNAKWGYFLSWSDLVFRQNTDNHLQQIYNNELVITLENI